MGCKECGKPKRNGECGCKSPKVLQINNPAEYITFHKVSIPAAMGDSTTNPPKIGAYRNALVYYEADHTSWVYSTDGIPTLVTGENGETGETGPQGPAGTIAVGTTTTGEPGSNASVENVGTPENAILNFTVPQGPRVPEEEVQEDVNNKLDEMAEDGTLGDIINQEIFGDINTRLNLLDDRRIVFIGDSYLEGWTPDGNVTSWGSVVKNILSLDNDHCKIAYHGGYGFYNDGFTSIVSGMDADSAITDVVVAGGYNDRTHNKTQTLNGMTSFKTAVATKFPNAKIHVAMIGWSNDASKLYDLNKILGIYKQCASELGLDFYNGCEVSLHDYYTMFSSDGIHPNQTGQNNIANSIINCLYNGNTVVNYAYKSSTLSASGSCSGITGGVSNFSVTINGNTLELSSQTRIYFAISDLSLSADGNNAIEVADITGGLVIGNSYNINNIPVSVVVRYRNSAESTTSYYKALPAILRIKNNKLYIIFAMISDDGTKYASKVISQIQLNSFSAVLDSTFC